MGGSSFSGVSDPDPIILYPDPQLRCICMVHILDGSSDYDAHVCSTKGIFNLHRLTPFSVNISISKCRPHKEKPAANDIGSAGTTAILRVGSGIGSATPVYRTDRLCLLSNRRSMNVVFPRKKPLQMSLVPQRLQQYVGMDLD